MSNDTRAALAQALDALQHACDAQSNPGRGNFPTIHDFGRMRRAAEVAEAALAAPQCRDDGRCQYAIDHGAEGMGSCPPGKCCMQGKAP